jgi:hypothetical protein
MTAPQGRLRNVALILDVVNNSTTGVELGSSCSVILIAGDDRDEYLSMLLLESQRMLWR